MSGPTEPANEEFDLHLNNGRLLEHFHEGNMTYRATAFARKSPDTFVEVSPELAEERGIQSGTWVQLISRYGKVRVRALVTDRVQGKELYMPMNSIGEPGESSHQQPHRYRDPHACVQRIIRADGRLAGNRGEPAARK